MTITQFSARQARHAVRTISSLVLLAALAVAGCGSSPKLDPQAEAMRYEFREQMILATRAFSDDNLEETKLHVARAKGRAFNFEQQRKVESFEHLVAGAEALRNGDADTARSEWSRIQDPALNREVRAKARDIGIDVPAVDATVAEKESQR